MTPFYFGEGSRRLFGAYDPAIGGGGRARAVVICSPWGPDHVASHGSLRRLASNIAAGGRHVLRFDYFAVGDSAGEIEDGELDGWRDDIALAIDEIKSMVDAPRVTLIGLRVGATLAAEVAAGRKDVDALVLWDPVVTGQAYLEEMRAAHRAFVYERTRYSTFMPTDAPNLCGYPLPPRVEAQLSALDLPALASRLPQDMLFVLSRNAAAYDEALAAFGAHDRVAVEYVDDRPAWLQDGWGFGGAIPTEALKKIVTWAT